MFFDLGFSVLCIACLGTSFSLAVAQGLYGITWIGGCWFLRAPAMECALAGGRIGGWILPFVIAPRAHIRGCASDMSFVERNELGSVMVAPCVSSVISERSTGVYLRSDMRFGSIATATYVYCDCRYGSRCCVEGCIECRVPCGMAESGCTMSCAGLRRCHF